jgi:hypothetical protein
MAISRRALRDRWGVTAPRLMVRTHIPWYWRMLVVVAALMVALTVAIWMYDAGRQFAGFDASMLEAEVAKLRQRVADLEDETRRLRAGATSSDSRLQIERSAGAQLARQLKAAESEIVRLREDLAFFDNLAALGAGEDKIAISRFKIEHDALPGEYRYRVLVTQGGRKEREFKGRLQFVVNMRLGGRETTVVIPDERLDDDPAYRISFRRFLRAEGLFKIDPGAAVRSVQVRIFEQGAEQPRAIESYAMT